MDAGCSSCSSGGTEAFLGCFCVPAQHAAACVCSMVWRRLTGAAICTPVAISCMFVPVCKHTCCHAGAVQPAGGLVCLQLLLLCCGPRASLTGVFGSSPHYTENSLPVTYGKKAKCMYIASETVHCSVLSAYGCTWLPCTCAVLLLWYTDAWIACQFASRQPLCCGLHKGILSFLLRGVVGMFALPRQSAGRQLVGFFYCLVCLLRICTRAVFA